jgi:DNA-binding LacI/PurR family transcriptional regulator
MKYYHAKTGSKPESKHDKIARSIASKISSGVYVGQLPGVAVLAGEFKANPITIRKALQSLEKADLIEKRERVGSFVKYKKRLALVSLNLNKEQGAHELSNNTIFAPLQQGIEQELAKNNYSLLLHMANSENQDFFTKLKNEVDGCLIIAGGSPTPEDFNLLQDLPWVRVMGQPIDCEAPQITYDNSKIGPIAAQYLIDQRCQRFVYFGHSNSALFKERLNSFKQTVETAGGEFIHVYADIATMKVGDILNAARTGFTEIFKDKTLKTGIHISADIFAVAVYQALYGAGLEPGIDVPVISCNNNPQLLHGLHPRPPSIDICMPEIGSRGIQVLMELISGHPDQAAKTIIMEPKINNQN